MFPKGLEPGDKMTMSFTKNPKPASAPSWLQSGASQPAAAQAAPAGTSGDPGMGGMPAVPPMDERAMLQQLMSRNRPL